LNEILEIQKKTGIYYAIPGPAMSTGIGVFICILLFIGASYSGGEAENFTSQLFLFLFLLMRLMSPFTGLNNCRNIILSDKAALDEADDFFSTIKHYIPEDGDREFDTLHSEIEFKNVSFYYDEEDDWVIDNLSFTINMGDMVAIVGPSGAGKSTVVSLLSRLYVPLQGQVVIDGFDLGDFNVSSWRRRISIVSQDTILFNDTVENNIGFGLKDWSKEKIVKAAKLAAADSFIRELPQGYDTFLGDRGVRLSGGQKQRISIARAFLTEPDILIMDEGTSSLDSVTEREIQNAIDKLSKNRTVIIIAHRLSTIRKADKILVMDKGQIVEEGSHDDLAALNGVYWDMLSHQKLDLIDDKK
jgi:subfamily B ATP-binding cassette protein MsbA